jgi:hypothetical protein
VVARRASFCGRLLKCVIAGRRDGFGDSGAPIETFLAVLAPENRGRSRRARSAASIRGCAGGGNCLSFGLPRGGSGERRTRRTWQWSQRRTVCPLSRSAEMTTRSCARFEPGWHFGGPVDWRCEISIH